MDGQLQTAISLLAGCRSILVFTGAGISTESGIPDYRGPHGVWTKVDPEEFTYRRYMTLPETRRKSWARAASSTVWDARPNAAHAAVVDLWNTGRVSGVVTQNVDGLHQAAGLPPEAVVEVHGNVRRVRCQGCAAEWPTEEILSRVTAGEDDPACENCGGILKATVISFGQMMPEDEMARAYRMAAAADAALAIGSTLSVYPAASIPLEVLRRHRPYIIVNLGPTEHDELAAVKVEGPAGTVVPALVTGLADGG